MNELKVSFFKRNTWKNLEREMTKENLIRFLKIAGIKFPAKIERTDYCQGMKITVDVYEQYNEETQGNKTVIEKGKEYFLLCRNEKEVYSYRKELHKQVFEYVSEETKESVRITQSDIIAQIDLKYSNKDFEFEVAAMIEKPIFLLEGKEILDEISSNKEKISKITDLVKFIQDIVLAYDESEEKMDKNDIIMEVQKKKNGILIQRVKYSGNHILELYEMIEKAEEKLEYEYRDFMSRAIITYSNSLKVLSKMEIRYLRNTTNQMYFLVDYSKKPLYQALKNISRNKFEEYRVEEETLCATIKIKNISPQLAKIIEEDISKLKKILNSKRIS